MDEIAQKGGISIEELKERVGELIRIGYLEQFKEMNCPGSCALCSSCQSQEVFSGLRLSEKGKKIIG